MARGDFFSGSAKKDNRIAGNLGPSTPIRGEYTLGPLNKNQGATYPANVRPKKGFGIKDLYGSKAFFSPSGNEVGQIASATTDLSGLFSQLPSDYKETEQKVIQDNKFNKYYKDEFGDVDPGPGLKQFLRQEFDEGNEFRRFDTDQSFVKPTTDTKIALGGDNLGGYGAVGGALGLFGLGLRGIQSAIEGGKNLKENIEKRLNPKDNNVSIGDRVGGFLNSMMGISPVAAGTLDGNQQVSQVSERPKLNYVNPDAKTMTGSEIRDAFRPKNIFKTGDTLGRYDDPGSPLFKQRQETMQNVFNRFTRPITPDARTIGQIRADQKESMQEAAKLRYQDFKDRRALGPAANIQKTFGADDTYSTGMPSNPAVGFREKLSAVDKARYDKAAREATAGARVDPSIGNVIMQTYNRFAGVVGLPKGKLETVQQAQLKRAQKEFNRPQYQKEAYARRMLGITNDMVKADNMQRIRANAMARNQAFQAEKAAKAVERAARRYGQNTGSASRGFGSGTVGKGMSSNPASQRQQGVGVSASNLSRHSVGHSSTQPGAKGGSKKAGVSGKTGRPKGNKGGQGGQGGQGGGPKSSGQNKSLGKKSRPGRKVRCDIRTKKDITLLTNQNLIRDDLAKIAYFVKELREK